VEPLGRDGNRFAIPKLRAAMNNGMTRIAAACAIASLLLSLPLRSDASVAGLVPLNWSLTPAQISASCKTTIAHASQHIDAIVRSRVARTFDTVVLPLENASADVNDELASQIFLENVSTDAKVRDASQACNNDVGSALAALTARPDLYAAVHAASASKTAVGAAQKKLTATWLLALKRSGAGLPDAQRREFVSLSQKLTTLETSFAANLGNDASTITITAAQSAGLSPTFLAANAKPADGGGYIVPVNESTYVAFMQNASDGDARKAFLFSYSNRGGLANVKLLEDAIAIRSRLAHLLGYPTWAAYVLADRMAGTPKRVDTFLSQLDAAIIAKARAEREEDAQLKGAPLEQWDVTYYENVLRKTKYSVDQNEIRQYFPVQHVVDSVLAIYEHLLGVKFTRVTVPVWQEQVEAFTVNDAATGAPLGMFYLDLFPRPGKYDHFANFTLIPRRVMPDGSVRLAQSAIVGNWPQPAPGATALLSQGDVQTFFHEFGHNMAAMLATGAYETFTEGFRQDFVEAPSQMLENWAWDPGILKMVSSNVTTGQPLPDDLIAKMVAARYVHYALGATAQIAYATIDMRYHTMTPPVDTTAVWKATIESTSPNTFVDGTHPQAGFGHLMGGYDAAYYGYLWSLVYAQDMFTRFKRQGLTNPVAGMAYRNDILAPARLEEPDVEVTHFLGRPMSPDAFYRELGITPPTK
jgi:thimet oligopeptidase